MNHLEIVLARNRRAEYRSVDISTSSTAALSQEMLLSTLNILSVICAGDRFEEGAILICMLEVQERHLK